MIFLQSDRDNGNHYQKVSIYLKEEINILKLFKKNGRKNLDNKLEHFNL